MNRNVKQSAYIFALLRTDEKKPAHGEPGNEKPAEAGYVGRVTLLLGVEVEGDCFAEAVLAQTNCGCRPV